MRRTRMIRTMDVPDIVPFFNPEASSSAHCFPICRCHLRLHCVLQHTAASAHCTPRNVQRKRQLVLPFLPAPKRPNRIQTPSSITTSAPPAQRNGFAEQPLHHALAIPPPPEMDPVLAAIPTLASQQVPHPGDLREKVGSNSDYVNGIASNTSSFQVPWPTPQEMRPMSVPQCSRSHTPATSMAKDIPLSFGTLNAGGSVCLERFGSILSSLSLLPNPMPLFLALVEFRPLGPPQRFLRLALSHGYHLVFDAPDSKGGVGMLLSAQVVPQVPPLSILIPGRLICVSVSLSPDPHFPPTSLCSFYGSNVPSERAAFATPLQSLLPGNVVLMGDFNATTHPTDASTLTSNHWNQLRAWELSGQLLDAARLLNPLPPFTRTRRYGGTQSYIDRIYFTQVAAQFLIPSSFAVPSVGHFPGFSDHDPLLLYCQPWSFQMERGPRCSYWNHKDLRHFNSLLSSRFIPPPPPSSLSEAAAAYEALSQEVRICMEETNSRRPHPAAKKSGHTWEDTVRLLLKHARRRTKTFYRRIKAAYFIPPPASILPPPRRGIQRILQSQRPYDQALFRNLPTAPTAPDPPAPSMDQLRQLARSVRRKAPGPDGIPPYVLCHFPEPIFSFVHTYITFMYSAGEVPPAVSESLTLTLYKGKGSWTDADRWRPIAMSNSIYRLLARWLYSNILPILSPFLSQYQFGGLRGRSCGMATSHLLNKICDTPDSNCCLFLDLYHAFDTPPKEALFVLLTKRGIPAGILRLLQSIFLHGSTRLVGPAEQCFSTSCGIKQGCPLSCLLFITYFQLFLNFLTTTLLLPHVAFVDDVAILLHASQVHSVVASAERYLSSLGLVLNTQKSEILGIRPMHPILDPPCPIVTHVMHLGHPLTQDLGDGAARNLIVGELKRSLNLFHDVPLPTLHRVRLTNTVILPAFLHRSECLWIPQALQKEITHLLLSFCLGVTGLPPQMSPKTIYSRPPYGLGLHHFPQRYSTRVLDTMHKAHLYLPMQQRCLPASPMQPLTTFLQCLRQNLPPETPRQLASMLPLPGQSHQLPHGIAAVEMTHPPPPIPRSHAYSDGSYFASSARAGAAAVLTEGKVLLARTPGMPGIYPSELLGAFLASHASPASSTIFLDNQGAVKALSCSKPVVRHAQLVTITRTSLQEKCQTVQWIKGHAGLRGNVLADEFARKASNLPPQAPVKPKSAWEVIVHGMPQLPPHKCWTESNVPTHHHSGIHPLSFTPLKRHPDSLPWIKWLFGLCWRPGWSSYHSFWSQSPSRRPCTVCHCFHNTSINGTLGFCDTHPLRKAWLAAWKEHPLVLQWVQHISSSDRMLLGKVCIARSLYETLASHLGRAQARSLIFSFQSNVLALLHQCLNALSPLPPNIPPSKKRKSVWVEADWDEQGAGLPPRPLAPRRPPPALQPTISSLLRSLAPS